MLGLPAGMMVGKALYEGILLNLSFAPFFIRCLQVRDTAAVPLVTLTRFIQGCLFVHHVQVLLGCHASCSVCDRMGQWCSVLKLS
jgi:hypothetical protein